MRVLFVDDEPLILEGLQNLLRRYRKKWDMAFAVGGPEALDELSTTPFDIIVTDMRMPGMTGAALLEQVRQRHPATARIMLSGYSEEETTLQALPVAHQYMSKPCDPKRLQQIISRVAQSRSFLESENLIHGANQLNTLGSTPEKYQALDKALTSSEESLANVAKVIESDIALTAKILQIVNSAFFGLPQSIETAYEATRYLGIPMLRQLFARPKIFESWENPASASHAMAINRRAIRLGLHVEALMAVGRKAKSSFSAGILCALGSLTTLQLRGVDESVSLAAGRPLGEFIMSLWGLPSTLIALPDSEEPTEPAQTLELAEALRACTSLLDESVQENEDLATPALDANFLTSVGWGDKIESLEAAIIRRSEDFV